MGSLRNSQNTPMVLTASAKAENFTGFGRGATIYFTLDAKDTL